jgi:hypothetical protein
LNVIPEYGAAVKKKQALGRIQFMAVEAKCVIQSFSINLIIKPTSTLY